MTSLRRKVSSSVSGSLAHPAGVIRALIRYTDWWQPGTSSIIEVGAARRNASPSEGIPLGLLGTLDERTELCRRMQLVSESERSLLFLWYLRQLSVEEIAEELRISRRQCFRRRARAIRRIVELGEAEQVA
jgi:DNA-directed RNA polymerase specialized sigma24 family protein